MKLDNGSENVTREIRELMSLFIRKIGKHYTQSECRTFAEIAVNGGFEFKKCFNTDHGALND